MAADVTVAGGVIAVAEPRPLFELSFPPGDFDVARDGRFLVVAPVEQREEEPTAVIVNWQQVVKPRA